MKHAALAILYADGQDDPEFANGAPPSLRIAVAPSLRAPAHWMPAIRGRLRRAEPDEALAVWKGLVAGQWSLVDQIDEDGRRYVLARRNPPEALAWSALGARERQVLAHAADGQSHKAIAFALGISTATVATHLRRAATKVGVGSRLALVRAFNARARSTP